VQQCKLDLLAETWRGLDDVRDFGDRMASAIAFSVCRVVGMSLAKSPFSRIARAYAEGRLQAALPGRAWLYGGICCGHRSLALWKKSSGLI
jgi:hypothetical protein